MIESINNKYAYRGDLETRLSFSKENKGGHLRKCGFDEEIEAFEKLKAGDLQFKNVVRNEAVTRNHSLIRCFHTSCNSKIIRTIGHIHSTIFEQPKALPPFTHLEVTFERNKEDFLLLTKQGHLSYLLQMQWMVLYIWKIELKESLAHDIEQVALVESEKSENSNISKRTYCGGFLSNRHPSQRRRIAKMHFHHSGSS